ncbi:MAG: hypothetical protein RL071_1729, partial [Pseudomonadota bacterium]
MSLSGVPQLVAPAARPALGVAEAEAIPAEGGDAGLELALLGLTAPPPQPARSAPPRSPEAFALDPNAAGLGFSPRPALTDEGGAPAAAPASTPVDGAMWWVAAMVQPGAAPAGPVPGAFARSAPGLPPRPPSGSPSPLPAGPLPAGLLASGPLPAGPLPAGLRAPAAALPPRLPVAAATISAAPQVAPQSAAIAATAPLTAAPARGLATAAAALGASPRTFDAAPWLQAAGPAPAAAVAPAVPARPVGAP